MAILFAKDFPDRPEGVPDHAMLSHTEGIQKWVWQGDKPLPFGWRARLTPIAMAIRNIPWLVLKG